MPKIEEIAAVLRAAISAGEYAPGDTIPREVDLAERFAVNRSTVRRAIALLRAEGLVVPVKRRGTVVRDRTRVVLPVPGIPAVLARWGHGRPHALSKDSMGVRR